MISRVKTWKNDHRYELYFATWVGIHVAGIALTVYDIKKYNQSK